MAEEDKETKLAKAVKKKAVKKKTSKKKVAKKKVAKKKVVAEQKAEGRNKSAEIAEQSQDKVSESKAPEAKPAPVTAKASAEKPAPTTAKKQSTESSAAADAQKIRTDDSAAWWLNLVLLLVLLAISGLLYVLMQQGALKGMNMDKIWSYFDQHMMQVEQPAQPRMQPDTVVVIETTVTETLVPVGEAVIKADPGTLSPLSDEQQRLFREAFMLPADTPQ